MIVLMKRHSIETKSLLNFFSFLQIRELLLTQVQFFKLPVFVGMSLLVSRRDTALMAARFLKQAANSCKRRAKQKIEPPYEITK